MGTHIKSNGSKWAGESPDSIEDLLQVLATEPLDPRFEDFGGFCYPLDVPGIFVDPNEEGKHAGEWRFFGNFFKLSHVFNIDTDEPEVIQQLGEAIEANMMTEGYKKARRIRLEDIRQELEKRRRHDTA